MTIGAEKLSGRMLRAIGIILAVCRISVGTASSAYAATPSAPTATPTATPTVTKPAQLYFDPTTVKYVDSPPEAERATATPTPQALASPAESAKPDTAAKDGVKGSPPLTPGVIAYRATRDTSYIDPASWSVSIFKKRHELIVYYKSHLYKTYRAVFGRSFEPGTKLWEGDRRTPEGVYTIIGKHPSRRWEWFLTLNYPNIVDKHRYEELRDGGVVPIEAGRPVGVGGRIGIHGSDLPMLNTGNVNWTTGCISVENHDIVELYKLLPIGTVVIIKP